MNSRFGALYPSMYRGFAAHGSAVNFDLAIDHISNELKSENSPGPPYFYDFDNGLFTQFIFAMSGAFSPNENAPQDYINPQIVEFPLDDQGNAIDSIYQKFIDYDPVGYIGTLVPADSVAILFGAGRNDNLYLFESNYAMRDTLDNYGLTYEYFDHNGTHGMPDAFKERALIFLDSIMSSSVQAEPTSEAGHWEMNEGSGNTTTDVSGKGNHGTLLNGASWISHDNGFAVQFDGIDDKIDCGNSSTLDIGSGDYSITGWIRPSGTQASYPTIISKGAGASYDMGYWLMYKGNRLWLYISNGTTRKNTYSNVVSLSPDEWYHLAVVIDRDNLITFYVNGQQTGTFDISDFDGEDIVSSKPLTMGIWQSNPSTAFNGALDRVILFNETLTEAQIQLIMSGDEQGNNAPVIIEDASADPPVITFPGTTTLGVTATDPDDDVLYYHWSAVSGPGNIDFSPNNSENAGTTTASFSSTGDYVIRVDITDSTDTVSSTVSISVVEETAGISPTAYWNMNEENGVITADQAGENDGTLLNGASWTAGYYGNGILLDGVNDRIDCGNNTGLDIGISDFSIATWIKMGAEQNTYPTIMSKGAGASYDEGYWLIYRSGRIWFYVSDGNSRLQAYSGVISLSPDTWHHLAVSFDRDELVTFYVDGEINGTFDLSSFHGIDITSSKNLNLGSWGESAFSFLQGTLDETRLYDVTLTADDVMDIMSGVPNPDPDPNNPPVISMPAEASPDTLFLDDTSALSVAASDSDEDILNYRWNKVSGPGVVEFNPNNSTQAFNTNASFSLAGNYLLRVFVSDGIDSVTSDVSVFVEEIPTYDTVPVAHWPMDEGSGNTTEDVSGTNDGILVSDATWAAGISGHGILFDGWQDRVDCGIGNAMDMDTADFTISAWLNPEGFQEENATILGKGGGSKNEEGYWFIVNSDQLRLFISDGTNQVEFVSDPISLETNTWYHAALVIDRDNQLTFYLDGNEAGSNDISQFQDISIISSRELTIGALRNKKGSFFNGIIDDPRLYNMALSADDILALYNMYAGNKSTEAFNSSHLAVKIYPNPASQQLTIQFELLKKQQVQISLLNLSGIQIAEIQRAELEAGIHSVHWKIRKNSMTNIIPGLYILSVKLNNHTHRSAVILQ
ncbi:MAG: T9SS type A sorting domain-containing protein [bacterium]